MASYAHDVTEPEFALGYRFDIVLRGRKVNAIRGAAMSKQTPSQTVGPFYAIGLTRIPMNVVAADSTRDSAFASKVKSSTVTA